MARKQVTLKSRIKRALRSTFAPYLVLDCYGTSQRCWTKREALEWLPSCSARARVINLLAGPHPIMARAAA